MVKRREVDKVIRSERARGKAEATKTRRDVAVDGRPHSTYSANFKCPDCGKYYTDHDEVDVTYYKLPTPDTIVGLTEKDGAIEVHCPCGGIFWNHLPLDDDPLPDRDRIVPPVPAKTKMEDGRTRATGCGESCEITECNFCRSTRNTKTGDTRCCFGGWNAGLGCYMDNKENVDALTEQMVGARRLRETAKLKELEDE